MKTYVLYSYHSPQFYQQFLLVPVTITYFQLWRGDILCSVLEEVKWTIVVEEDVGEEDLRCSTQLLQECPHAISTHLQQYGSKYQYIRIVIMNAIFYRDRMPFPLL